MLRDATKIDRSRPPAPAAAASSPQAVHRCRRCKKIEECQKAAPQWSRSCRRLQYLQSGPQIPQAAPHRQIRQQSGCQPGTLRADDCPRKRRDLAYLGSLCKVDGAQKTAPRWSRGYHRTCILLQSQERLSASHRQVRQQFRRRRPPGTATRPSPMEKAHHRRALPHRGRCRRWAVHGAQKADLQHN